MIIIGDVHSKQEKYINAVREHEKSLCVGDVGFNYDSLSVLDSDCHKIVAGNHDNYENLSPHFLGDFGVWNNIFYVRGAWSIDKAHRTEYVDWFPQEQLTYMQFQQATELCLTVQPEIIVTHEAPAPIKYLICGEANDLTSIGLGYLFEQYQPKGWIFGHHHISWRHSLYGTDFQCLSELETCLIGE